MPYKKNEKLIIKSKTGMTAVFSLYGAGLEALYIPDENGILKNIIYYNPKYLSGAVIAPVAGRIRNGIVNINGIAYKMPCKDGVCCHSGEKSTAFREWKIREHSDNKIVFEVNLEDMECGLPGNMTIWTEYRIEENQLEHSIKIKSDKDTFVNPTSHIYWNLSGNFNASASNQNVMIPSKEVWYNNSENLPVEKHNTEGTIFDFQKFRIWDRDWKEEQMTYANGFNHAFKLAEDNKKIFLIDKTSGIYMQMETDSPYVVFYSGGKLPVPGCGLAFEPQMLPDMPFLMGKNIPILHRGDIFYWKSTYKLGKTIV